MSIKIWESVHFLLTRHAIKGIITTVFDAFLGGVFLKTLGYYNGTYGELEEMQVPMLDRACYFGDGIYDATYSRNHKIYALEEHLDRFYRSAALLGIAIGETKEELAEILCEMVKKVDSGSQFVYFQATRGTGLRDHAAKCERANLWIMLKPCEVKDTYQPIKVITMEDKRYLYCHIKTLNLIPSVLYATAAGEHGCDETILHRGGIVTECAHSNVSILKDGVFRTAPLNEYILPGTARAHLIKTCQSFGIPVEEKAFTLAELFDADEVIISSAGSFCVPVSEIDGRAVGGKAPLILKRLQDALVADFLRATE